jgi:hypothetical protein
MQQHSSTTVRHRNALAGETSPYLLQHAGNPVEWYPWGDEALRRARAQNKPILLSIGYSACHWCHVMAHESFEDEAIAALMNEHFVNVKVDREERPDLDKIYQTAHYLLTRRNGGWPLTMFLSPADQMPFFGGTYFPNRERYGMPAFPDVLRQIAAVYHDRRGDIEEQNERLRQALESIQSLPPSAPGVLSDEPLMQAIREAAESFEPRYGGFGGAPKFPHPASIERLLRHAAATPSDDQARAMAYRTLEGMARGGLFDHLCGGFCRYSVDDQWLVPHFEKMLYDNGPLLATYVYAWQLSGNPFFRQTAEQTAAWAIADMQSPGGAFYSSRDADSEGHEGKYYVWTREEVEAALEPDEYAVFARRYGLNQAPNFEGKWHLHARLPLDDVAREAGLDATAAAALIAGAREKLRRVRFTRVPPGRDEKILTSWNALMIKGLAVAGRVFDDPSMIAAAVSAADFIRRALWRDGRLLATYKDGRAHHNAYLDDYAFLIDALLALLEARWRDGDLEFAVRLAQTLVDRFEDVEGGGFYFTSHDHEKLIQRSKSFQDDATPSGNGIAAFALGRLGHLLGETRYLEVAERTLRAGWPALVRYPFGHNAMLLALEEYLAPPRIIVLRAKATDLPAWRAACGGGFEPRRLVLAVPDGARLPGLLAERRFVEPGIAYVCEGHTCLAPVTSPEALRAQLRSAPR